VVVEQAAEVDEEVGDGENLLMAVGRFLELEGSWPVVR
jgi:hypothetical protein